MIIGNVKIRLESKISLYPLPNKKVMPSLSITLEIILGPKKLKFRIQICNKGIYNRLPLVICLILDIDMAL